ncbi:MAG TPA: hypothetical protein VNU01_02340, partial [Egibacteraceae bacterium]|nr:hypothetical protein [Egibacteraceae bacterium]
MIAGLADRYPWAAAAVFGAAGFALGDHAHEPADFTLFAEAGGHLLRGDVPAVLGDAAVQAGPLLLALMGLLDGATAWLGGAQRHAVLLALCLTVSVSLLAAVRALLPQPGAARGRALLAAGVAALAFGVVTLNEAHPTHAVVPLLWLLAALACRRDRPAAAGVLLGLAAGLDSWGVLGA